MKYIGWIVGVLGSLLLIVYVVAFTSFGNSLLKPVIEEKIQIQTNLDSKLKTFRVRMSNFEIFLELNSNNSVLIKGDYSIFSQSMDILYSVNLEELKTLQSLTSAQLDGSLHADGKVVGDMKLINVDGTTNFASSETTFSAIIKDLAPASVVASVKHLKLQEALSMVKQPHYGDALFSLEVDISNADVNNLKGVIKSKITEGIVDSNYMTKAYAFKTPMPATTFNATTFTNLSKSIVDTKVDFNSNLANFDVASAKFNTANASLKSDYEVFIKDLDKLFFATQRHLKGAIKANGKLSKAKDLDFTIHSNIADGKVDATLHNDDFHAELNSLQTLKILDMLLYPKVFKSAIKGKLNYNLLKQKGVFNGHLVKGTFTPNKVLDLTKRYARINLYKEIFSGDVSAKINKENILASLDLKSNKSSIKTEDTKLNSKTQELESKIDINANGKEIAVLLTGDVNSPKVKIDAKNLMKQEAKKVVKKELNNYLNKSPKGKEVKEKVNKLLKKWF